MASNDAASGGTAAGAVEDPVFVRIAQRQLMSLGVVFRAIGSIANGSSEAVLHHHLEGMIMGYHGAAESARELADWVEAKIRAGVAPPIVAADAGAAAAASARAHKPVDDEFDAMLLRRCRQYTDWLQGLEAGITSILEVTRRTGAQCRHAIATLFKEQFDRVREHVMAPTPVVECLTYSVFAQVFARRIADVMSASASGLLRSIEDLEGRVFNEELSPANAMALVEAAESYRADLARTAHAVEEMYVHDALYRRQHPERAHKVVLSTLRANSKASVGVAQATGTGGSQPQQPTDFLTAYAKAVGESNAEVLDSRVGLGLHLTMQLFNLGLLLVTLYFIFASVHTGCIVMRKNGCDEHKNNDNRTAGHAPGCAVDEQPLTPHGRTHPRNDVISLAASLVVGVLLKVLYVALLLCRVWNPRHDAWPQLQAVASHSLVRMLAGGTLTASIYQGATHAVGDVVDVLETCNSFGMRCCVAQLAISSMVIVGAVMNAASEVSIKAVTAVKSPQDKPVWKSPR
jgi:hypothetical protein